MGRSLTVFHFIVLLAVSPFALAQNSLIETVLTYRSAIVQVTAVRLENSGKGQIGAHYRKGAGVIIDQRGFVVTNLHTIQNADKIGVKIDSGMALGAKIVHILPENDLALLQLESAARFLPIPFADNDKIQLGDEIINIGTSYYLKGTISGGRITGLGRSHTDRSLEIIQVNLDLYEGDSGGPLLNRQGQLIGMMSAKRLDRHGTSLAISANKIKKLYLDFLK